MCGHLASKYTGYVTEGAGICWRLTDFSVRRSKLQEIQRFTALRNNLPSHSLILTIFRCWHQILLPSLAAKAGFAMVETGSKHSPSLISSFQNNLESRRVMLLEKYLIHEWASHVIYEYHHTDDKRSRHNWSMMNDIIGNQWVIDE